MALTPSKMSGSGWESLPDVRKLSGGPPGCSCVVRRPSQMSESSQELSQMSVSGPDALQDVREWP